MARRDTEQLRRSICGLRAGLHASRPARALIGARNQSGSGGSELADSRLGLSRLAPSDFLEAGRVGVDGC